MMLDLGDADGKLCLHGSMVAIAIIGGKYCIVVIAVAALAERASKAKRAKILVVYAAIVDTVGQVFNKLLDGIDDNVEGDGMMIA
ncbi:hypothetical protein GUJ93_ZPchr0111g33298 [Zizania palustris]|uniref:Uncharacterized protein n=1 Tax=Zizania palustris TaxID=103762 RepID=A0A8J5QZH9_ZIZPA|nr:hypothetical protein GUJ93_ZPchr0111g33298 [Zizania palustris]